MSKKINHFKYSGYIFGFVPIIKEQKDKDFVETWQSSLHEVFIEDDQINFQFVWGGDVYKVNLFRKKIFASGKIKIDGEIIGECDLSQYLNEKGILLIGNWIQEKINYNCIIELKRN